MRIKYDPEADAIYIKLRDSKVHSTKEIGENTVLDFDESGEVIGIEILFVRERNPDILRELQVENLISA